MSGTRLIVAALAATLLPAPAAPAQVERVWLSASRKDDDGFLVHEVRSPYQAGKTLIRVLRPETVEKDRKYPVVYVLPVEAGTESRYGDGLKEVQKLGLPDKLGAVFVAPTFSHLPWFADHPTRKDVRQETYFLHVVVPFVEKTYPVQAEPRGRLLLGFSKSGWGAYTLLLRHPDVFGRAAAWDAPLAMDKPGKYGSGDVFGTPENFAGYRVARLLEARAEAFRKDRRLILLGYGNFRGHHRTAHELMEKLKIAHEYRDGPARRHDWHGGWVTEAAELLLSDPPLGRLTLHVVPAPIKSYRLLAMSRDDDGYVWAGSVHHYDPRTGGVKTVPLPARATASACICAGNKIYVLGQSYPRLIVYDRTTGTFTEKDYPSAKPDVWYGTGPVGGRHLYLFDRGGAGVIKWDTRTDTGQAVRWPYQAPLPSTGEYVASDNALWCRVWDLAGGKYVPVGLARLDAETDKFTGFYPFPTRDADLKAYTDPKTTFFLPDSLKGRLVPFDFQGRRWCRSVPVPGHGERFGFIGGPTAHRGRLYFSLSTYDGDDVGCDGKPYHFLNSVLEFDPQARRFDLLTLDATDAYHQIAYMLSACGEFFATGTDIREPGGVLNRDRAGEVVFWQTRPPDRK